MADAPAHRTLHAILGALYLKKRLNKGQVAEAAGVSEEFLYSITKNDSRTVDRLVDLLRYFLHEGHTELVNLALEGTGYELRRSTGAAASRLSDALVNLDTARGGLAVELRAALDNDHRVDSEELLHLLSAIEHSEGELRGLAAFLKEHVGEEIG